MTLDQNAKNMVSSCGRGPVNEPFYKRESLPALIILLIIEYLDI